MEKITKLHPVFLTFEGWVSTEGEVTVPENTMGACPKCWSPVVPEELLLWGVCVCCGWKGVADEVIHQENQMFYQIQYNSSKHQPSGALPFLDYWKSRRAVHIATIKSRWVLEHTGGTCEVPGWLYQLEALDSGSTEARLAMLQRLGILDKDGKLVAGFGDHLGYLEAGGLQASKALYQYPEHSFRSTISNKAKNTVGEKHLNKGEEK